MKLKFMFSAAAWLVLASPLVAQHSDIEFGYDDTVNPTSFIIENDETTIDGFQFWESEMEELDPFNPGDFSADEPGFATNAAEGLLVNPSDQIFVDSVDASLHSTFGKGFVNFYDPGTGTLDSIGRIGIEDNSGSTVDLILNGGNIESGDNPQFLGLGDSGGDIHDHLVFDLLDDGTAPLGAYGVMLRLQSDFATADGNMDLSSDPFWVIFNHGMSEADFDSQALPAFGVSTIPEPTATALLGLLCGSLVLKRKRRRA